MHVALTGVSGFIGSVVARHLRGAGHSMAGLIRPSSRRDHVEPFVERFPMSQINEIFERTHRGEIDGRPVLIPDFD